MGRRRADRDRRRAQGELDGLPHPWPERRAGAPRSARRRHDASPASSIPPHEWRTGPCRRRRRSAARPWPSRAAAWPTAATTWSTARSCSCRSARRATRSRARTPQGVVGPNLDEAWQQADKDGLGRSTYEGLVHQQILHPSNDPQVDPQTGKPYPQPMPANLVTGQDAKDVAAYVAQAAAAPGEDGGRLAQVGAAEVRRGRDRPRAARSRIPADPCGALAYEFGSAEAPAGQLTIDSQNEASIPHNIALEGDGVDEVGPEVTGRRRRRRSRSTSSRASTRSTAPCPATARAAWRARSPSSRAAAPRPLPAAVRRLAGRGCRLRLVAVVLLRRVPEEEAPARRP